MAIKLNNKDVTPKLNGKTVKEVRYNGRPIYPSAQIDPGETYKCGIVGFTYEGIGEADVAINGVNKHVLLDPQFLNPDVQTMIDLPVDCVSFMDVNYRYKNNKTNPALYTYVVTIVWSNLTKKDVAMWNNTAPIYVEILPNSGNKVAGFRLTNIPGDITFSGTSGLTFKIENNHGAVVIEDNGATGINPLNYNIEHYNFNNPYAPVNIDNHPLLINGTNRSLTVEIDEDSYVLEPYDNDVNNNYLRIDKCCFKGLSYANVRVYG